MPKIEPDPAGAVSAEPLPVQPAPTSAIQVSTEIPIKESASKQDGATEPVDPDEEEVEGRRPRRRQPQDPSAASDVAKAAGMGLGGGATVLIVLGVGGCCGLGVISVLVALLVPAVQKVREAAARTQSINNLKQITLGFHSFHDANKRLPFNGATTPDGHYHASAIGDNSMSGSWGFQILPYIGHVSTFNNVDRSHPVATFLCPGRGRPPLESTNGGGAWTDYFLNNLLNDRGVRSSGNNPSAIDARTGLAQITDGTSNTIFIGHGNINISQYPVSANVALSTNIFLGGTPGTVRAGVNPPGRAAGIPAATLQRDSSQNPLINSWGGPFSQGGLMAMGDGTVRMFTYNTNNFNDFLTPNGAEQVRLPD